MSEGFHWLIFALHSAAALVITFGVRFRCDQSLWVSRMHVDSYSIDHAVSNKGMWWDSDNLTLMKQCSNQTRQSAGCFLADLPLYERETSSLGWHLFGLLGHFEWISAAFAFFYIEGGWTHQSWAISTVIAITGTLLYLPWQAHQSFANETILLIVNGSACAAVFYEHRNVHTQLIQEQEDAEQEQEEDASPSAPPPSNGSVFRIPLKWIRAPRLHGMGNLQTGSLRLATLPALRFAEYCITASALFVAVLSLFVPDAPAFITIGGYAMIILCNLYGVLLHYSLVADHASPVTELRIPCWRGMSVPRSWMRADPTPLTPVASMRLHAHGWGWSEDVLSRRYAWGSFIASNNSTLLNSWFAFALAMLIVLYQQTFLFSTEPPWFVVMSGWIVLVMYTLFGAWVSAVYMSPAYWAGALGGWGTGLEETYLLIVRGLDILSVVAKLSIVGILSFGFVFSADGYC